MVVVFAILGMAGTATDWPNLFTMSPSAKLACFILAFLAHVYSDIIERMVFVFKVGPPIKWLMIEAYLPPIRWATHHRPQP